MRTLARGKKFPSWDVRSLSRPHRGSVLEAPFGARATEWRDNRRRLCVLCEGAIPRAAAEIRRRTTAVVHKRFHLNAAKPLATADAARPVTCASTSP